jgi:hypothetical protein
MRPSADIGTAQRREAFIAGVEAFERERYALEHVEGERPYGFEIAGITASLREHADEELASHRERSKHL